MPSKASRPCSTCGQRATEHGKCARHAKQQRQRTDQRRGTNTDRGYGTEHRERFRPGVMEKDDWTCQLCGDHATVADHWPKSRKELLTAGLDPDDPKHGRALCCPCHSSHTMTTEGQGKHNLPNTR